MKYELISVETRLKRPDLKLFHDWGFKIERYREYEWSNKGASRELVEYKSRKEIWNIDIDDENIIDIKSIEDLEKIQKDFACPLVIDSECKILKIYNDYME